MNFATRQVKVDDRPTELTDLEIRLLRYFVDNADRAIPREELLENVWEVAASTNTRTVDNFIVRLRKLFELDSAQPQYFVTVRGLGYRFVTDGQAG